MKFYCLLLCLLLSTSAIFAQGALGTITGTISDPTGAVVGNAAIEIRNTATGAVFKTVSTATGNYTITQLPVGTYELTATVTGFKTYKRSGLDLAAAQIMRIDVPLEVGSQAESVTVTADASLLKTETGDMTHNVTMDTLTNLPLLGIGTANSGTSGVRNPYNSLQALPGVSSYNSSGTFTLNGLGGGTSFIPALTETMRVEGQDATSRLFGNYDYTQMGQPSVDSIQEIAYQTSNYAAEFGQAGVAVINMTMKSGSNQYHGSGYDYFVNEDLNAGNPFSQTKDGEPGKFRPRNRRNDFGGTLGGPIYIPKVYNGHDKTFFFWNYEQFLESTGYSFTDTVPTAAYLNGDFSAISGNGTCTLCAANGIQSTPLPAVDALSRPMYANEIYDPLTRGVTADGLGFANPFPNNVIPLDRIDPTAKKIIALLPQAQNANLVGNYTGTVQGSRYSAIPSIKIDHNISSKDHLSFFWSRINTESQISSPLGGADGLPTDIGGYRGTFIPTYTTRLNYDRTVTPTILLHLGVGYYHTSFNDHAPNLNFDPASLGLSGFLIHRQFPAITGMCTPPPGFGATGCAGVGGMQNLGEAIQSQNYEEKPTFNANLTWIRGNHTFKIGGEMYLEQPYTGAFSTVTLATGLNATSQPFTPTGSLNGFTQGFGFASFLLGDYGTTSPITGLASTTQTPQINYRAGNQQWGLFLQDTWKITRKLTLDYGLRWDYATAQHEQYGRVGQFDPTAPNANAGGHPGATIYAATCNCQFYQPTYPYGIGPRIGLAYQINPKTVLRAGWGVNYQFVGALAGNSNGIGTNGTFPLAGINPYVNIQTPGSIVTPVWPVFNPNRFPVAGTVGGAPAGFMPDANQNRPPRINQWSVGIQRELTRDFVMEASYVANRAVWLNGPYGFLSQLSAAAYAKYGLYPYPGTGPAGYNNLNDRNLLLQPPTSQQVVARLGNILPYAGFPGTTLQSALYPFPQFGALTPTGSPTGDSKYDSLQIKATKRFSHGFQAGAAYTWAKGFATPATPQDFFNPSASQWQLQQIPPQALTFNFTYTIQKYSPLPKFVNEVTKDWEIGFFAIYQSGIFLTPPTGTNPNFLTSEDVRTGQPLYLHDINNIHSYNPYTDVVLNPAAWKQVDANVTGPAASTLYTDFRGPRQPRENANFGRHFKIKERYDFYIRGEFVNIFNRTILPNPTTTNPQNPPSKNQVGVLNGGFGVINAYNAPGTAPGPTAPLTPLTGRTGTVIARFTF
jgi:hypothetical protein